MKKILIMVMAIILFATVAYASKAFIPLSHQTIQSIGCVDTSNTNEIEFLNCDGSGNLVVTIVPASGVTFTNGVVDIPNAGATDRTQLTALASTSCVLQALPGNTGPIYIGGVTVTNAGGANEGIRLNQNDSISITTDDLDAIYAATDNAGDDIKFLCN